MSDFFHNKAYEDKRYAKKLGLTDDTILLGNVGRFSEQKNHKFLISVFEELSKLNPSVRLILIGKGELYQDICNQISDANLQDKVIMPGVSDEVNELYSAMDLFVMTSSFEGLPLVGVEAQTSGLTCVFSDAITKELQITDKTTFMSLDAGSKAWANKINSIISTLNLSDRSGAADVVRDHGYDKNQSAELLAEIYKA